MCFNCLLTNYGKSFRIELVYLPLNQLDVILGMNWLEFNHVHISCFDKTMMFPEIGEIGDLMFSKQVEEFLKDGAHVFAMFSSFELTIKLQLRNCQLCIIFRGLSRQYQ